MNTLTVGTTTNTLVPVTWSGLSFDLPYNTGEWLRPLRSTVTQRNQSAWSWIAAEIMTRLSGYQGA